MRTRGINAIAPVMAAVLLAVLLGLRVVEREPSPRVDAYMTRVAAQIDAVPYRIENYIGVDDTVTPGVIELLQPNRILQRTYRDPETGDSFSLVFVHCKIAKDMTGHYPPNCYPRAGWVEAGATETMSLEVEDTLVPAWRYHFRFGDGIVPIGIDILSFFVVPSGPQRYGPDIRLVDLASRTPSASVLGAGQVQVLTPQDMSQEQRERVWDAALRAVYPALHEIAEGAS